MKKQFWEVSEKLPKTGPETLITQILERLHRFCRRGFNLCNLLFNLWNHKERLFQSSLWIFFIIIFSYVLLINPEVVMSKPKEIQLPQPVIKGKISLEETILKRRSQRDFLKKDLTMDEISQLLWAGQGITGKKWDYSLRAAPSAGALYPMELYLLSKDGLFHYLALGHKLELVKQQDLRDALAGAALYQDCVREAAVDIVICAVYERVTGKYGQRGIRYVHIEAGHIAQNIHLQAVALGLGSVPIGAFSDEQVKKILTLPKDQEPLYIIPVGYPK